MPSSIIRIERTTIIGLPGYSYELFFSESNICFGKGHLVIDLLLKYEKRPLFEETLTMGLDSEDIITGIATFLPHKSELTSERQGIGKLLLDKMVEDSLARNAKLMHGYTSSSSMQNFLRKHGFTEFKTDEDTFYKLL